MIPHPTDPEAAWFSLAEIQSAPVPEVQRVDALVTALTGAYRSGDHGSADCSLGPPTSPRSAGPRGLPFGEDPEDRGALQPRQALPDRLVPLPPGLPGGPRQLPARVSGGEPRRYWFGTTGFLSTRGACCSAYVAADRPSPTCTSRWSSSPGAPCSSPSSSRPSIRSRYFVAAAAAVSTISLILADNVPILDGSIAPLVPVLRHNMWLTIHVLTITLGYAAFTLAMGIGPP